MVVYMSFKINQNEIAKTICIQRKLVNNSCNGSCELQKSLKSFNENEREMDNHIKEKIDLVYLTIHIETTISTSKIIENRTTLFSPFAKKPISVSNTTFHPPLV